MIEKDILELLKINEKSKETYKKRLYTSIAYLIKPFFMITIFSVIFLFGFFQLNPNIKEYSFFEHLLFSGLCFAPFACLLPTIKFYRKTKITKELFNLKAQSGFEFLVSFLIFTAISVIAKYNSTDPASYIPYDIITLMITTALMLSILSKVLFLTKNEEISLNAICNLEQKIYNIELEDTKQRKIIAKCYNKNDIENVIDKYKNDDDKYNFLKTLIS